MANNFSAEITLAPAVTGLKVQLWSYYYLRGTWRYELDFIEVSPGTYRLEGMVEPMYYYKIVVPSVTYEGVIYDVWESEQLSALNANVVYSEVVILTPLTEPPPPQECPDGTEWDPDLQMCVPVPPIEFPAVNWGIVALAGVVAYYAFKR